LAAQWDAHAELEGLQTSAAWVQDLVLDRVAELVTTLSYFLELKAELELLSFSHNAALMEDQVDVLWILARPASDLMASHILPSVVRGSPDVMGGVVVVVDYTVVLLLLCKEEKTLMNEKVTSYYPFSLSLSVLPSAMTSRSLVVFGAQLLRAFKLFENKGKHVRVFGDVGWLLTQSG
jgi:hypothetical protein